MTDIAFKAPSSDKIALETGTDFTPRFDANGLVTAVVTDADDGELLMVAFMNAQALALTLETGLAHYWSRSRNSLWRKGDSSGAWQAVVRSRRCCSSSSSSSTPVTACRRVAGSSTQ